MTSPKQTGVIQAARKSTGPRTRAGKEKSRLNAYRHGLAAVQVIDPSEIQGLASRICKGNVHRISSAITVAECLLILRRVRWARIKLLSQYHQQRDIGLVTGLERLDRYEGRAHVRLMAAVRELSKH